MQRARVPRDEIHRQQALASLNLHETAPEERFDRIALLACRMFGAPIAMISLISADRQWCKSIQGLSVREFPRDISLCAHTILHREPTVISDTHADPAFSDNPLVVGEPWIRFYAGCPLYFDNYAVGTIAIVDREPREFGSDQVRALRSLGDIVESEFNVDAMQLAQSRLSDELDDTRRRELLDGLTGIWNRRGIEELLPRELSRAARGGDEVALMLIEVDGLAKIRGDHGPDIVNNLLEQIAGRLRACVRQHDVLARFAENEFLVFDAKCDRIKAHAIAERMLAIVNGSDFTTADGDMHISLSVGIYSMQDVAGRSMSQIIDAADQALFQARDGGGNRVVHY
jgi:diguanylate cyclase (GGDEF)-like protein